VLTPRTALTDPDLAAIAALEGRVVAADGGRLKLEWGTLRHRPGTTVTDLLWHDRDTLIGFAGLYQFGGATIEIAGMVDPRHRRTGVGSALLIAAVALVAGRDHRSALLVTPRTTPAGAAFAAARGGQLHHAEHAMVLDGIPPERPERADLTLRPAGDADRATVAALLVDGFGFAVPAGEEIGEDALVGEIDGSVIATLRVSSEPGRAGIYGFAVDAAWRGQGIGRDVLTRVCRAQRAAGVPHVHLEVEVANDYALGLYTSVGFRRISTEDYFTVAAR